jgi:predicted 2-oxoglutarate/Fe(II)-dependent dioxygenase YbiX
MLERFRAHGNLFDDDRAAFFGVSWDPEDEARMRIEERLPGFRVFWDFDHRIARLYGLVEDEFDRRPRAMKCCTYVLDRGLRVLSVHPLSDPATHADEILIAVARHLATPHPVVSAPVLEVPRVLEPELCRQLIEGYQGHGGEESGFMREVDGRTVGVVDHSHKRRRDWMIDDTTLVKRLGALVSRRLNPEVEKAFAFKPTRMERYLVACYSAETGGYFRPHRDNTTLGTAHRRFAVTINLNTNEYEGGALRFPEYGDRLHRASTGGAIVFSCSLLHEAMPVTKGRRYAFLPFLYDEAAAAQRIRNLDAIADPELRESVRQSTKIPEGWMPADVVEDRG